MSDMTNEELAEALEDLAANRAGGTAAESNYDPELLVTMMEAAARLRQQSEDSARLDWLEDNATEIIAIEHGGIFRIDLFCRGLEPLRNAIDKARSND